LLLILCTISCNGSVLPWPAKSPNLNHIEHVWDLLDRRVRARTIPPRNVRELVGALVKSGVTPHSKNWQIWCSPWGEALQYLLQLVATPDTDYYFWTPLCVQGHINQFMLVTCLWNLFSLMSVVLLCSYKYLHMLCLLKINCFDIERTFLWVYCTWSFLNKFLHLFFL
jgi:hypothetical protein